MDREQEDFQFLGYFGILKESFRLVSSRRKIFAQITAALILPLSIIYHAQILISDNKITANPQNLEPTPEVTPSYNKVSDVFSSELIFSVLFKIVFSSILGLVSTSVVVYTIACIYTANDITFKKVMSVVPKVWKRLIITYLCFFIIVLAFSLVTGFAMVFGMFVLIALNYRPLPFAIIFIIPFFIGSVYISMIWHLAAVVSVLEESYGLDAMYKSRALIKGKILVSVLVLYTIGLFSFAKEILFKKFLVSAYEQELVYRLGFGLVFSVISSILVLFGLISQTVIYFVCKSYHKENIDKSSLLLYYISEDMYVPLKSTDFQKEDFQV